MDALLVVRMVRIKTRYLVVRYELYDKSTAVASNISRRDVTNAVHEKLLGGTSTVPVAAVVQATKVLLIDAKAMLFLIRTERRFIKIVQNCLKRVRQIKKQNLRKVSVIHIAGSLEQCRFALKRIDRAGYSKEPSSLWKNRLDII